MSHWLLLTLICLTPASQAAEPGVVSLGKEGQAAIEIVEAQEQATVKIKLPDGILQSLTGLGENVLFLQKDGKVVKAVAQDYDGDGAQELVFRTGTPPKASHVYVFRYDSGLKKFRSLPFADKDRLTADYNEPVEVLPDAIALEVQEWEDEFKTGNADRTRTVWKFRRGRFLPF